MSEFNNIYYTKSEQFDGFGAQYQGIMSIIAFCKFNNYIYIHTPFTRIGHNVDINKLNHFIGINNNILINNNLMPSENENIIKIPHIKEIHYHKNPSIYYTNIVIKNLKDFYYCTEKPNIDNIEIAIHIRRGDVNPGLANRYTNDELYKKLIPILKTEYPGKKITIVSQGKAEDFKDLGLEQDELMLNTDFYETFHNLVCAKVLVVANSSYSYSAGLLNPNTVYCTDFWHKPLDHWKSIGTVINNKKGGSNDKISFITYGNEKLA